MTIDLIKDLPDEQIQLSPNIAKNLENGLDLGWLNLLGLIPKYEEDIAKPSPFEPQDPMDCRNWPQSPFCGGGWNPFDLLGFDYEIVYNECEMCLRTTPNFLGFSGPPIVVCKRLDDCAPPPPPPPSPPTSPGDLPPPSPAIDEKCSDYNIPRQDQGWCLMEVEWAEDYTDTLEEYRLFVYNGGFGAGVGENLGNYTYTVSSFGRFRFWAKNPGQVIQQKDEIPLNVAELYHYSGEVVYRLCLSNVAGYRGDYPNAPRGQDIQYAKDVPGREWAIFGYTFLHYSRASSIRWIIGEYTQHLDPTVPFWGGSQVDGNGNPKPGAYPEFNRVVPSHKYHNEWYHDLRPGQEAHFATGWRVLTRNGNFKLKKIKCSGSWEPDLEPPTSPPPPPPLPLPPPPCNCMNCCCSNNSQNSEDNDDLLRYIAYKLGTEELPAQLPASMIGNGAETVEIPSVVSLVGWKIRQDDAILGQWPVDLKVITDEGQEKPVTLHNISEFAAEAIGTGISTALDADNTYSVATKSVFEVLALKAMLVEALDLINATNEFLGFKIDEVERDIDCQFDLSKADDPVNFFQAKVLKTRGWQNIDKVTLLSYWERAMFILTILKETFYKTGTPEKLAEDIKTLLTKISSESTGSTNDDDAEFTSLLEKVNGDYSAFLKSQGVPDIKIEQT